MKAVTHQSSAWETWRPGVETRMLISARNGAKELCLFEQLVAPGAGAPGWTARGRTWIAWVAAELRIAAAPRGAEP